MKIVLLTAAALVFTSATANAQASRRPVHRDSARGQFVRAEPAPVPAGVFDNTRADFAAHVSANGQGTN